MSLATSSEPKPPEPRNQARTYPEDGPQDVPQTPGSVVEPETALAGAAAGGADAMLAAARGELGQGEHPPGSNHNKYTDWYGLGDAPWCDIFMAWCADRAGCLKAVGRFAYTPWHAQWFKDHGRWGDVPRKGAIVFYDWGGSRDIDAIDHVGVVEAVRGDGTIVTLEGNTEDMVRRRVRSFGIVGYGYPDYASGGGPAPAPSGGSAPAWPGRFLRQPPVMTGGDVRTWQQRMSDRGWNLAVDGAYGPGSESVCRRFQSEKSLEVDGVVGPLTWRAAWS
ncbi:CHAP domain-containing protein [Actinomadura rupiterrae]|uniref:CHAP domain-containing protein n=1 Tax=Actinomadura rupiterrae TaxID=559627 RepID=UPI0020A50A0F|nr:CHAP domain-containing protein [Actinomadura rupiterrae]MCP2341346.1 surface antigen [Actinomadura rupiterrae]